ARARRAGGARAPPWPLGPGDGGGPTGPAGPGRPRRRARTSWSPGSGWSSGAARPEGRVENASDCLRLDRCGGEAVACDDNGVASFDLVRHQRANESIFLYAFDLIELNGDDLRRDPLEVRKATLASIVAKASPGIRFNEHLEGDGPTVFAHACKMGLEGIVSKRKDSAYRSGCSPEWLKMKNFSVEREGGGLR